MSKFYICVSIATPIREIYIMYFFEKILSFTSGLSTQHVFVWPKGKRPVEVLVLKTKPLAKVRLVPYILTSFWFNFR